MRLLQASIAPRALNSELWVRRLVNSCGQGFANGGTPGLGRYPFYEVNDGPGQEDPDHFIRCLVDDAYQVWVERDRMIQHVTNQIRSLPWVPVTAMAFKLSKRSSTCRIYSRDRILRDMWVSIFYVLSQSTSNGNGKLKNDRASTPNA